NYSSTLATCSPRRECQHQHHHHYHHHHKQQQQQTPHHPTQPIDQLAH
ncbi:unnamed protein product, partial [Rotaria sp. Silwood1]